MYVLSFSRKGNTYSISINSISGSHSVTYNLIYCVLFNGHNFFRKQFHVKYCKEFAVS